MVAIDAEACTGCGDCIASCPFGAMHFDKQSQLAFKCTLCRGEPACAAICPTGAISFSKQKPFTAYPQALHIRAFALVQETQKRNLLSGEKER